MENIKICAAVLFLLIMSCDSLTPSAPEAEFAIAETYQHDNGYAKYCRITVRVENIGSIPILRSTISIELKTDKASYFRTIFDDRGIPPATVIFLSVEFELFSFDEVVDVETVKISDWYID